MVPGCKYEKNPIILVAFNSASGQTAINALPNLDRKPDGFVGLDPFSINDRCTKIDDASFQDTFIPAVPPEIGVVYVPRVGSSPFIQHKKVVRNID